MRVVSLLPSATETLCLIGGASLLVGRSHECDFPHEVVDRPALTSQRIDPSWTPDRIDREVAGALAAGQSLYSLDTDRLQQLRPDVILTQDLCEVCSIDLNTVRAAAARMNPRPEIVSLNPHTYEAVLDDIITIGRAVGMEPQARQTLIALRERFFRAADHVNAFAAQPKVAFLEWADPPFIGGHWTPQLVERAGGLHPLNPTQAMEGAGAGAGGQMAHRTAGKSIRVPPELIERLAPDFIVVCPCGIALRDVRAHLASVERSDWWRGLAAVRQGRVALVDGNQMFNRPGPRLVDAYQWLVGWLNDRPELIPAGFPWEPL
jgi:ABC-type Fe3+-hydroxamate transport system substrate-binding protein